jgi:hypothetical protein
LTRIVIERGCQNICVITMRLNWGGAPFNVCGTISECKGRAFLESIQIYKIGANYA